MALTIKKSKLKTDFSYVPLTQKGNDKPFTVQFEALPLDTLAELQDAAIRVSKDGEYSISINTLNYAVIKKAIMGWNNVEDDNGPVRFKRDNRGATDSSLALIPADIRSELATVIVEVSKDLPNAEAYLEELDALAQEDAEEIEVEPVTPKPRTKKA